MTAPALLRRLVPRAVRRRIAAGRAEARGARVEQALAGIAAGNGPIVAGPWLGEVGFELLYWIPFLAWFADRFGVAPERLTVLSRGGTRAWYGPLASTYHDVFDTVSPAEFRERHDERVRELGEQKQIRMTPFERELLARAPVPGNAAVLHPSTMYELMFPFWWGHVDEQWVFRHARYRRLPAAAGTLPFARGTYTAAKFYFNECFPESDETRAFVRRALRDAAADGPVVSLTTGLRLDDHDGADHSQEYGVAVLPEMAPRTNLEVQSAVVAGARRFIGTYGGFSYLAPFLGVPATAYYANEAGFSPRHLTMARSALETIGSAQLLQVRSVRKDITP